MPLSFARKPSDDKNIVKKSKTAVARTSVKGGSLVARIEAIVALAKEKLINHLGEYITIRDVETLKKYIDTANVNGECALDTETTGLNPITDKIVGVCLYTPTSKSCYIPINHKSYITGARISNQLNESEVAECLKQYSGKWIMHNAKFDIRFMRHSLGYYTECYWDTQLGANLIDENESHRLKDLHFKYCDSKDSESLTFDTLFNGITFDVVPIETATLYAAGDPKKTYELYQYQKTLLNRRTLTGPYNVMTKIEMPLINVVADMEDRGICLDSEVCKSLHNKYNAIAEDCENEVNKAYGEFKSNVEEYRMRNSDTKLSEPINARSPQQLAIFLYDVLKLESPDRKSPRGTGAEILSAFIDKSKSDKLVTFCKAVLKMREVDKLLSTYIDKMPEIAESDGRVHCSYKQYGAKTGRFSSENPKINWALVA